MKKYFFTDIAIVTSAKSWFLPYAQEFERSLQDQHLNAKLFVKYEDIDNNPKVVFILSYFSLIQLKELKKYPHNFVVHESDLPQGKWWAPLFWQILEGKNEIPVVLFEAAEELDAGPIYLRDAIILQGNELHDEIRSLQAKKTQELCLRLLYEFGQITPMPQSGLATFYSKRTPAASELDVSRPLQDLFDQLRVASNDNYPACFYHRGTKYVLKITKQDDVALLEKS